MAQKLICAKGYPGNDLLTQSPIADAVEDGYTVTAVTASVLNDTTPVCFVLLESAASEGDAQGDEPEEDTTTEGGGE